MLVLKSFTHQSSLLQFWPKMKIMGVQVTNGIITLFHILTLILIHNFLHALPEKVKPPPKKTNLHPSFLERLKR